MATEHRWKSVSETLQTKLMQSLKLSHTEREKKRGGGEGAERYLKQQYGSQTGNLHPALICLLHLTNQKLLNHSLPAAWRAPPRPLRALVAAVERWCSERPQTPPLSGDWIAGDHEQRGRSGWKERVLDLHHRQHPEPEAARGQRGRRRAWSRKDTRWRRWMEECESSAVWGDVGGQEGTGEERRDR